MSTEEGFLFCSPASSCWLEQGRARSRHVCSVIFCCKLCSNLTLPCNTFYTFLPPCLCSCHSRLLKGTPHPGLFLLLFWIASSSLLPAPSRPEAFPRLRTCTKQALSKASVVCGRDFFFFFFNALAPKQSFPTDLALNVHHLLGWALRSGAPPHQPATIYVTYFVALTFREGFPGKTTWITTHNWTRGLQTTVSRLSNWRVERHGICLPKKHEPGSSTSTASFPPGWGNSCLNSAVCALKKEIPWWPVDSSQLPMWGGTFKVIPDDTKRSPPSP